MYVWSQDASQKLEQESRLLFRCFDLYFKHRRSETKRCKERLSSQGNLKASHISPENFKLQAGPKHPLFQNKYVLCTQERAFNRMSLVKLVSRRPQAANFFNKAALEPKIRWDLCETLFLKYCNMPKKDLQRKKISGRVHSTVTLLAHVVHQIYVNCRASKKTLLET